MKSLEQLTNEKLAIDNDADKRKYELECEFAKERQNYFIGDIIKTAQGAFLIDRIECRCHYSDIPRSEYSGLVLTKSLKPRKDKTRACADDLNANNPVTLISRSK